MTFDAAAFLPATVHFCEARLGGLVAEPANTWSSLGYILVGAWLFARRGAASRAPLATVAIAEIGIGVGSIALHGTGTFAGEVLDLTGMFLLSACLFALGFGRLGRLSDRTIGGMWAVAVALPLGLLAWVHGSGIASFSVLLAAGIGAELVLYRRDRTVGFRRFAQSMGIFGVAFTFWILDMTRLVCLPDNHVFTGHAAWHLLNAWSIERLYAFYQESLGAPDRGGVAAMGA
jgi:hypothetical protein